MQVRLIWLWWVTLLLWWLRVRLDHDAHPDLGRCLVKKIDVRGAVIQEQQKIRSAYLNMVNLSCDKERETRGKLLL